MVQRKRSWTKSHLQQNMVALAGTCSATSTGLGLAVRDATISTINMLVQIIYIYSNPVHFQRVLAVNLHCQTSYY